MRLSRIRRKNILIQVSNIERLHNIDLQGINKTDLLLCFWKNP